MTHVPASAVSYAEGPFSSFVTDRWPLGGLLEADLIRLDQPSGRFHDETVSSFSLVVPEHGGFSIRADLGAGRFASSYPTGSFMLAPPGAVCSYDVDGDHRALALAFDGRATAALFDREGLPFDGSFGGLHAQRGFDSALHTLGQLLRSECEQGCPHGAIYHESLAVAIVSALYRMQEASGGASRQPAGRDPARIQRVREYVRAHLGRNLSLSELADVAGCSTSHLHRMFRASEGVAPYAYVLRERVEEARRRVVNSDASLAEIAHDCGFSSQAHMTTSFRRLLRVTPGQLRTP